MSGSLGTTPIASPTGAETIIAVGTNPELTSVSLSQIRDASGYAKVVPTTGATYVCPDRVSVLQATPAGGLSAWTVKTPVNPVDGQRLRVFTTQTITTFNLTASGSQTVDGNPNGSLSANAAMEWVYSASNTTWDRIL